MGFDYKNTEIVGVVAQHRGEDNARIKVLGHISIDNKSISLTEKESIDLFPPDGYIFGPSFFKNSKITQVNEGDLIKFKAEQIENVSDGKDHYCIFNFLVEKVGYQPKIFRLKDLDLKLHVVDLSNAVISDCEYSGDFYGLYENFVLGKLRSHNGKISPAMSKEVKKWNKESCELIQFKSSIWLLSDPTDGNELLDAMNQSQLFEWFREKLQLINKGVVKELDDKTKWRTLLPNLFSDSNDEVSKLNSIRLKRIESNLDNFDFLYDDFQQFTQNSEKLRIAFISAIERHKIELRQDYAGEIEEFKMVKENEKQRLEHQLSKINLDIAHKKRELSNIIEEINSSNSKIEIINSNKDRILSDFSIIQEVLGSRISTGAAGGIQEEPFVIETVIPSQNTIQITQRDKLLAQLKNFLNQRNINYSLANKLIPVFASCKGVFLKTIELGLAFIDATGNSKYIIQQVEPDWLHFKDLWRNGLEAIWKSSHENPTILHFLILEDINLSSPECYMRPLLDCMNGIRKISYAKTKYPDNLRILATKISSEEPKIGLPLYDKTFKNWGAIGFTGDNEEPVGQYYSIVEGYLEVEAFLSFKSDEPIEDYTTKFIDDYKVLFDNLR